MKTAIYTRTWVGDTEAIKASLGQPAVTDKSNEPMRLHRPKQLGKREQARQAAEFADRLHDRSELFQALKNIVLPITAPESEPETKTEA